MSFCHNLGYQVMYTQTPFKHLLPGITTSVFLTFRQKGQRKMRPEIQTDSQKNSTSQTRKRMVISQGDRSSNFSWTGNSREAVDIEANQYQWLR